MLTDAPTRQSNQLADVQKCDRLNTLDLPGEGPLTTQLSKGESRMRLYSYIITDDTGFSPNPFHGYCTLACCKPAIRRTAKKDDWVVSLTPKEDGNRIVYLMRVDESPKTYREYWHDKRFKAKRPRYDDGVLLKCGDNIYEPLGSGYRQLRSMHNPADMAHDLGGKYVLISETFAYFGSQPHELPHELTPIVPGRGHRSRFSEEVLAAFRSFTQTVTFGVHAEPRCWPKDDTSWKAGGCGFKVRTK